MRITVASRPPDADDVPTALEGAVALLGQRPAITGLHAGERREQGFASLAGWVAKGANLLTVELGVAPGDRLALGGPPGWPLAAVALSAWWVGMEVVPLGRAADASVAVMHTATVTALDDVGPTGERFVIGDALDGSASDPTGSHGAEAWTEAVTPHGDRPPPAVRDGSLVALTAADGTARTQRELLAGLRDATAGVLGLDRADGDDIVMEADAADRLAALALRPLVTGSATVVLDVDGARHEALAAAERVATWFR